MQNQAIDLYQPDVHVGDLKLWRVPEEVLAEAQLAAVALQKRITGKAKPVIFNGQQYIENDDWQMLSNFFGYAPKIVSTEFVEYGEVQGFKAIAELIHEHTGKVVGRGEALCLNEEENWGPRTKYEWRDVQNAEGNRIWDPKGGKKGTGSFVRERVEVGEVNTPLFQLMSMAQTRACNKAMSNKLKWVVSLAGYQTTPAEDMHEATLAPEKAKVAELPTEIKKKSTSGATEATVNRTNGAAPVGTGADGRTTGSPVPAQKPITPDYSRRPHTDDRKPPTDDSRRPAERVISEAQARRFYSIRKGTGWNDHETKRYLQETFGIEDDRKIPVSGYEAACAWAEGKDI